MNAMSPEKIFGLRQGIDLLESPNHSPEERINMINQGHFKIVPAVEMLHILMQNSEFEEPQKGATLCFEVNNMLPTKKMTEVQFSTVSEGDFLVSTATGKPFAHLDIKEGNLESKTSRKTRINYVHDSEAVPCLEVDFKKIPNHKGDWLMAPKGQQIFVEAIDPEATSGEGFMKLANIPEIIGGRTFRPYDLAELGGQILASTLPQEGFTPVTNGVKLTSNMVPDSPMPAELVVDFKVASDGTSRGYDMFMTFTDPSISKECYLIELKADLWPNATLDRVLARATR